MRKRYSKDEWLNGWIFALICILIALILGAIGLMYICIKLELPI